MSETTSGLCRRCRSRMSGEADYIIRITIAVLAGTGWGILLAHYAIHGSILP